jgi:hypothetical protein
VRSAPITGWNKIGTSTTSGTMLTVADVPVSVLRCSYPIAIRGQSDIRSDSGRL